MTEALPAVVLENTFTLNDVYQRANMLSRFFEKYFFDAHRSEDERTQVFEAEYRGADADTLSHVRATAAWGPEFFNAFSAENMYERIRTLKEAAEILPRLSLDVPVPFSAEHVERIGLWCRTNVQPNVMLELRVRPESVGGCVFVYNNILHDVSLSYFAAKHRAELLSVVRAYG